MWRNISRGFQRGLKRSVCAEKPDVPAEDLNSKPQVKTVNHCLLRKSCIKEILPCVLEKLNHFVWKQGCRGQNQKDDQERSSGNISQHTFLEAFGWSGALVFGWVISKQLWLKQSWTHDQDIQKNRITFEHSILNILAEVVKTQPPSSYVLPQLQPVPKSKTSRDENSNVKPDADEEFEAAASELRELHEKTMGQALNRRGIACLSRSTGSEAISYFKRASKFKYPPASFNMGQCCELGIGTKQDFKQAAEWYQVASDQGHATAMYNLGVFYAHGWGGLKADIEAAKKLFIKAANLGQPDAKAALDKESYLTMHKTSHAQLPFMKNNETVSSSEMNFIVNHFKNGLSDEYLHRTIMPESNWNPIINEVPVAF